MPADHLGAARFDGKLGRADVRVEDLPGVPCAQGGGVSGMPGGAPMGADSGQAWSHPEHGSRAGDRRHAKLSDPIADVWALHTERNLSFLGGRRK